MKTEYSQRIGFMQGRLVPLVDGRIQAFPWNDWETEFRLAAACRMARMEWTLDHERLRENPLMTEQGRARIAELSQLHGAAVSSVTADCFMQAPFWRAEGRLREERLLEFRDVLHSSAALGVGVVVVPLVDSGSLRGEDDEKVLASGLQRLDDDLGRPDIMIAFESDYPPARLQAFIAGYPADRFGINFDIGNSASLGWDPEDEIARLGHRIVNVHVKDRALGGTTVPLGQGNADLPLVFGLLREASYAGNFILQTARAADGDHVGAIRRYRDLVARYLE